MQEKMPDSELIGKAIDQINYAYHHLKNVKQYNAEIVNIQFVLQASKDRLIAAKQDLK